MNKLIESHFVKTSKDEVLRDLQQNMLIPFHTIHDEIDLIVDSNLAYGIMSNCAMLASAKDIWDILGTGYIDYIFDVEYDKDGSWTPNSSFDIYTDTHSDTETQFKSQYESVKDIQVPVLSVEVDDFKSFIPYAKIPESFSDAVIVKLTDSQGNVKTSNKCFSKRVALSYKRS